jgi:hypothetical protein
MSQGAPTDERTRRIMAEVDQVKGVMHDNVTKITRNMDNLEQLQDKTGQSISQNK